jgi:hypothetical protein
MGGQVPVFWARKEVNHLRVCMPEAKKRIIVNSIGEAGANLIPVLKKILPLAENRIAALLYQAPSELISNLPTQTAKDISKELSSAGLDCEVVDEKYDFMPGESEYEVALVIQDFARMNEILEQIMIFLGVNIETARKIVCTSPTVLIGNVSENTVKALQHRFQPIGVELDVSRPAHSLFDIYLGNCQPVTRQHVLRMLEEIQVPYMDQVPADQPLLAAGLSKEQADQVWDQVKRTSYPVRLVNREFQRFDLSLDEAPDSPEMVEYLMVSTGMPETIAKKVLHNTPMILQQNIRFQDLVEQLETISGLGGRGTGHLLVFQTFSIKIEHVGDQKTSASLLKFIGTYSDKQTLEALSGVQIMDKPLTHQQAHWLQAELKKVNTKATLILHE